MFESRLRPADVDDHTGGCGSANTPGVAQGHHPLAGLRAAGEKPFRMGQVRAGFEGVRWLD